MVKAQPVSHTETRHGTFAKGLRRVEMIRNSGAFDDTIDVHQATVGFAKSQWCQMWLIMRYM